MTSGSEVESKMRRTVRALLKAVESYRGCTHQCYGSEAKLVRKPISLQFRVSHDHIVISGNKDTEYQVFRPLPAEIRYCVEQCDVAACLTTMLSFYKLVLAGFLPPIEGSLMELKNAPTPIH